MRGVTARDASGGWCAKAKRRAPSRPAPSSVEDLVAWLAHPNSWQRETAQRLLMEKKPEELKGLFPAIEKKTKGMVAERQKMAEEEARHPVPLRIDLLPQPERGEVEEFIKKNPGQAPPPALLKKLADIAQRNSASHNIASLFLMHWTNLASGLVKKNGFAAMKPAEKVGITIFPGNEDDFDSLPWFLRRHGANFFQSAKSAAPLDERGVFAMLCDGRTNTEKGLLSVVLAHGQDKPGSVAQYSNLDDVWMQRAVLSASSMMAGKVLAGIVADGASLKEYQSLQADFVRELASASAADADSGDFTALLSVLNQDKGKLLWWKPALLQGLAEGLPKSGRRLGVGSLAELVAKPPADLKDAAAEITALFAEVDKVGGCQWAGRSATRRTAPRGAAPLGKGRARAASAVRGWPASGDHGRGVGGAEAFLHGQDGSVAL